MAILLEARLVTDWPEIDKYIQEPLYQAFNKTYHTKYSKITSAELIHNAQWRTAWSVNKDVELLSQQTIPDDKMIYYFNDFNAYFMEICCVPKYHQKLIDYGFVDENVVKRAQEALNNKNISSELKQDIVFQVGFDVGHHLLKNFWKIDLKFQSFIEKFYNDHFKGNKVIAIQLRYHYINWEDTKVFIDCANTIENELKINNIKWFITSDNNDNLRRIEADHKNKVIHTLDYFNKNQTNSMYAKYGSTILDNEMLGKSDFLIISGGSTFGFTGALRKEDLPFYVNGQRNQTKYRKLKFSEPSITNLGYAVF